MIFLLDGKQAHQLMAIFPGTIIWGEDLMQIPLAQPKKVAMG